MSDDKTIWGLMVEFEELDPFIEATEKVRDAGYKRWDTHTPYPVHGLAEAQGLTLTKLPYLTFAGGLTGCTLGLVIQWWTNAVNYPYIISGKPLFSMPTNIPVMFELTILLAAISTFVGMLALNNLPLHYHPLLTRDRFKKATDNHYFISIEAADPAFDAEKTLAFARELGGIHVELVED